MLPSMTVSFLYGFDLDDQQQEEEDGEYNWMIFFMMITVKEQYVLYFCNCETVHSCVDFSNMPEKLIIYRGNN